MKEFFQNLEMCWRTIAILLAIILPFQVLSSETTGKERWILVIEDDRAERSKGWRGGVGYQGPKDYRNDLKLKRLENALVEKYSLKLVESWPIKSLNVHCLVIEASESFDSNKQNILKEKIIKWVQPFQEFELLDSKSIKANIGSEIKNKDFRFNDPYYKLQDSYFQLNLNNLNKSINGRNVSIALIDSGIQQTHPDLKEAQLSVENFVAESNSFRNELEYHGTAMAAVIAAQPDNNEGIVGVAPKAKVIGLRACWETKNVKAKCNTLSLSRALDRVIEINPDIVNLSLTGPKDQLLDKLINRIVEKGIVVVAAYDDKRKSDNRFPSLRNGVVYVGETPYKMTKSNDYFIIPGTRIITAQPGDSYAFIDGSSISSAQLSGLIALIKQQKEQMSPMEIQEALAKHYAFNQSFNICELIYSVVGRKQCTQQ